MLRPRHLAIAMLLITTFASHSLGGPDLRLQEEKPKTLPQDSISQDRGTENFRPVIKTPTSDQAEHKASDPENHKNKEWLNGWTITDIIAAIASVAGILQVATLVITIWLMRKTAERQLRAYVFIKDGAVEITPDGGYFVIRVNFRNFGQTPGYQYSTWLDWSIHPVDSVPFSKERGRLSERTAKSIIGPTAETPIAPTWVSLAAEDLEAIRNKTKAIFIWGGVDYVDAFNRPRHFIFKMRITGPELQSPNGLRRWPLAPHPLGYEEN